MSLGLTLAVVAGIGGAASRLPMPLLVLEPGPTTNVARLIQMESPTFKSKGSFLLTTVLVSSTDGVTLPDAVGAAFDPDKDLVPKESIFPSDSTRVNTDRMHAAQMSESQQAAAVAALHQLGMTSAPEGAFVREVDPSAPAADKLRPGDVIVAVEGEPVLGPEELQKAVGRHRPGQKLQVNIRRDGEVKQVEVETKKVEREKSGTTRLGVMVIPKQKLPVDISIDAGGIGGPSAGLVFALAIYDALTSEDLTGGRKIAGTGGIVNSNQRIGVVTGVGGVAEKVTAAGRKGVDVFLVPKANAKQARSAAPDGLEIVEVATVQEAIEALRR